MIELADGIFTGPGNRDVMYNGKALTVRSRSGDPATCILDCQGTPAEYHRGFYFYGNEGPDSRLERITIRNGYVEGED